MASNDLYRAEAPRDAYSRPELYSGEEYAKVARPRTLMLTKRTLRRLWGWEHGATRDVCPALIVRAGGQERRVYLQRPPRGDADVGVLHAANAGARAKVVGYRFPTKDVRWLYAALPGTGGFVMKSAGWRRVGGKDYIVCDARSQAEGPEPHPLAILSDAAAEQVTADTRDEAETRAETRAETDTRDAAETLAKTRVPEVPEARTSSAGGAAPTEDALMDLLQAAMTDDAAAAAGLTIETVCAFAALPMSAARNAFLVHLLTRKQYAGANAFMTTALTRRAL